MGKPAATGGKKVERFNETVRSLLLLPYIDERSLLFASVAMRHGSFSRTDAGRSVTAPAGFGHARTVQSAAAQPAHNRIGDHQEHDPAGEGVSGGPSN
jgi:hypothetical protein